MSAVSSAYSVGQRHQIVAIELAHVLVPQPLGDGGDLPADALQESVDVFCFHIGFVALFVLRVLGRDAGNALAHVALHAGDAAPGNEHRAAEGSRIGTQAQGFDRVDAVAQPAHEYDLDVVAAADVIERIQGFHDCREGWNTDEVDDLAAAGAGGALHAVQLDEIETVLDGDLDVVAHPSGAQFDAHR